MLRMMSFVHVIGFVMSFPFISSLSVLWILVLTPQKACYCMALPVRVKPCAHVAVANRTDACFIRVIGSELVQKYVGEVS